MGLRTPVGAPALVVVVLPGRGLFAPGGTPGAIGCKCVNINNIIIIIRAVH